MKLYKHYKSQHSVRRIISILVTLFFFICDVFFLVMVLTYDVSIPYYVIFMLFLTIGIIISIDMIRSYVEISDNNICVVNYYFFVKRTKHFTFSDIASAETHRYGYKFSTEYIALMNSNNKCLFIVFNCEENKKIFKKYYK